MRPIMVVVGTRPEGIKMAPVYRALKRAGLPVFLCATSQHDQLLSSLWSLFDIAPDADLKVMKPGQDLFYLTTTLIEKMRQVLLDVGPSLVLVQGDTTTTMAAALAAFYLKIPIGHVEAGLRTHDLYSPFPEEMNRRFVTLLASYHFAPTTAAATNVLAHGVHRDAVFCTGNTVVDALCYIKDKMQQHQIAVSPAILSFVQRAQENRKKIIVVTMHRRESFGDGLARVFRAIKRLVEQRDDITVLYPMHPNPHVQQALNDAGLMDNDKVFVCDALLYPDMIYALSACSFVMTDSGGLQEEATSLNKYTLVLREHTERIESVLAGCSRLVGTAEEHVFDAMVETLESLPVVEHKARALYGDGHAAERIVEIIVQKMHLNIGPLHQSSASPASFF